MEKLSDSFKAIVAVFHGIIATWLFIDFSERKVDEFHFIILLVFFSVANILIWNLVLRLARKARLISQSASEPLDFQTGSYRFRDGVGLSLVAIAVGLAAAYLDRKEAVLWLGNKVANWHRTSVAPPFEGMMADITTNTPAAFDKRSRQLVSAAKAEGAFVRVYVKDLKLGYEGYPGRTSTVGDVGDREAILSPACRFSVDEKDSTRVLSMQRIEGPGVFIRFCRHHRNRDHRRPPKFMHESAVMR